MKIKNPFSKEKVVFLIKSDSKHWQWKTTIKDKSELKRMLLITLMDLENENVVTDRKIDSNK